jgi:AraC-like DNA-binding protein
MVALMGSEPPAPVDRDSRGILDPWLLQQRVHLTRYPVGEALDGLIDRFWAVRWDLPDGQVHGQEVLTHPGCNLSVGHPDARVDGPYGPIEARLYGVARRVSTRVLAGTGWTVAAMTTPGGMGAFTPVAVSTWCDQVVPVGTALGLDEGRLIEEIGQQPDEAGRVGVLARALETVAAGADADRVRHAREVAGVARLIETDRSLRRLPDLSSATGIGPRTLQRLFLEHAGVSPTWVLRRYRLLEAAEAVRDGQPVSWTALAYDLGYADQAHLSRDFRSAIGRTPTDYAAAQAHPTPSPG